jgi:Group II intron, maturase-specific domain
MERRIRELNRFTVGWTAYFSLADTPRPLSDLDAWLRRRLRQVRRKEWKRYRTKRRNLRALGIPEREARESAASCKGYWRIAGSAPFSARSRTLTGGTSASRDSAIPTVGSAMRREPPGADPHAGWCGRGRGEPGPYPILGRLLPAPAPLARSRSHATQG